MNLSPIVLFVYNRQYHTKQTIEALKKNELSKESELFIYSDAPKNKNEQKKVNEVRKYIKTIDGFKKVTIIEREKNLGLANSIIDGVTNIVNEYGKIIVLEDDLVTSPYFLKFMNDALEFYLDNKKVWHISGWNYPIETDDLKDIFLWRGMNCWGWATWADRWKYYENDAQMIVEKFTKSDVTAFNLDGYHKDFWAQLKANKDNKLNTWAIFWYAVIFLNRGLSVNPSQTYVQNIGIDDSGENCNAYDIYKKELKLDKEIVFINSDIEDEYAIKRIKQFYKDNPYKLSDRLKSKLKKLFL
jgi:hypothetical protein